MSGSLKIKRHVRYIGKKMGDKITFILSHLSLGGKLALFALSICLISLLFPWFYVTSDMALDMRQNMSAFSSLIGNIGYLYVAVISLNIFYLLSVKNKAKLRYVSGINIHSAHITSIISWLLILSSIHIYFVIRGLSFFSSEVAHSKGIILFLTGAIILTLAGKMIKKEEKQHISGSYSRSDTDYNPQEEKKEKEKNMKLPV